MARYFDIHPVNPQPRLIEQVVALLRDDGLIAYPTDSGYALGIQLGNRAGLDRMRTIRHLDDKHHFTLLCHDFAQMGPLVHIDNAVFRAVKAATPGPYTFILPATSEVPRRLMAPKKRTVGVRIPDHVLAHALLEALGEPLISTTLLLPGHSRADDRGLVGQGRARSAAGRGHRGRGGLAADDRRRLLLRRAGDHAGTAPGTRPGSSEPLRVAPGARASRMPSTASASA